MRILRWLAIALLGALLVPVGVGVAARFSDGPLGPFPGGPLRSGPLVSDADVDWSAVLGQRGARQPIELGLVEPPSSRTTGVMLHEGQLYVPCDLGFMWARFSGRDRLLLHTIYLFKHWHQDALRDGRALLRIGGRRYERQAVRVTDPELLRALRAELEDMGRQWLAPEPLGPAPTAPPNDVWFFRMDPRPAPSAP